ncbi:glycosyltransferase [Cyanobacteria bacterium FACHB-63]|nr:glycosyltransferase [Cyanobacteria bacterium FACHB-63]
MKDFSIAFFVWGLSSDAITNIASALSQGFWRQKVSKIYVLYLNGSPAENTSFPQGVEFVHLGVHRARQAPLPIAQFLRTVKPTFLISLAFLNVPATLGWLLGGRRFTKLVISQQNTLIYKTQIEHKGELLMQLQLWFARLLYSKANGLVTTTRLLLEELINQVGISLPKKHTAVIPNLVDLTRVMAQAQVEPSHPWLKHKEKPVVLSVARLAKQKNFSLLLRAFAEVRKRFDARLIIIGEGPEREKLEQLVNKLGLGQDVSLPGASENPWSSMARADVFVLPSEEEAFGLVLVEAMVCSLPVIATDAIAGGPRTILGDSQYGLLVPNQDVKALENAIDKVLSIADLRAQLITAGKQRCEAFSSEAVAQQWLSFLEQL